jgi:hypothetical protein
MQRWYLYGNRENIQGRLSRANHRGEFNATRNVREIEVKSEHAN